MPVDQSDGERLEIAEAREGAMERQQHAVDLVWRVVLHRDAGREGLLARAAHEDDLQLAVLREAGERRVELGEQVEIQDVERRAAEGERRRAIEALDGEQTGELGHRRTPAEMRVARRSANAAAAARKSSNRPR